MDVADGSEEVRVVVDRLAAVPALEEVTGATVDAVEVRRIATVELEAERWQSIEIAFDDEVVTIAHQAVGEQLSIRFHGRRREHAEKSPAVVIVLVDDLPASSSREDMVDVGFRSGSQWACHVASFTWLHIST